MIVLLQVRVRQRVGHAGVGLHDHGVFDLAERETCASDYLSR
jgi:hypothetical protein